jgi:hypothetical protein
VPQKRDRDRIRRQEGPWQQEGLYERVFVVAVKLAGNFCNRAGPFRLAKKRGRSSLFWRTPHPYGPVL